MRSAALIGCGRIGFLLEDDPLRSKPCTHFGGLKHAGLRLAAVCDINTGRSSLCAVRAGISRDRVYSSYVDLLKNEKTDVVTIAVPTPLHAAVAVCAAELGAKIIVCEKPIAHSIPHARKMVDACLSNNAQLIINHERRFDARYRKVRQMIDKGMIGRLAFVRGTLPTRGLSFNHDHRLGGGPLLHDGTHLVDILTYFAGKVIRIDGRIYRKNKGGYEDHARAMLETEGGVPAYIEVGGATNYFGFSVEIFGEDGKIEIGNGYARFFKVKKSRFYTGFKDLSESAFPKTEKKNCFTQLYRETITGVDSEHLVSSGEDGLHALQIIHGIYLSAYKERPVGLPNSINIKKIFAL